MEYHSQYYSANTIIIKQEGKIYGTRRLNDGDKFENGTSARKLRKPRYK
jgi:hypothetical protein